MDQKQEMLDLISKEGLIKRIEKLSNKIEVLDKTNFELRSLIQIGKGLGDILNLKNLLQTYLAILCERYSLISASVSLIDDDNAQERIFNVSAQMGLQEKSLTDETSSDISHFSFKIQDGYLWQMLLQGSAFSVQDINGGPRFADAWEKHQFHRLNSDLWCPLIKKGDLKGILTLGRKRDGSPIPEQEYPYIEHLASIAITNIDSVIKYEKIQTILKNIKVLYDVNQQLAQVKSFKDLLQKSLDSAVLALNAQSGNLMMINTEEQVLELAVAAGSSIPEVDKVSIHQGTKSDTKKFTYGEGVAGRCWKEKRPIRENSKDNIIQTKTKSIYCLLSIPLIYAGEVMGVLNFTNKVKKDEQGQTSVDPYGRFSLDDESLTIGLADQAAINIHKSRLYNDSITDKMTGLFNRRHFDLELAQNLQQAEIKKEGLGLLIADIDHFKRFNDVYGHIAGDTVIRQVAQNLMELSSKIEKTSVFRYGGEEVCMLLPGFDVSQAFDIAESFRSKVDQMVVEYLGNKLSVQISVGLAYLRPEDQHFTQILKCADEALYKAKEWGRNMLVGFYQHQYLKIADFKNITVLRIEKHEEKTRRIQSSRRR